MNCGSSKNRGHNPRHFWRSRITFEITGYFAAKYIFQPKKEDLWPDPQYTSSKNGHPLHFDVNFARTFSLTFLQSPPLPEEQDDLPRLKQLKPVRASPSVSPSRIYFPSLTFFSLQTFLTYSHAYPKICVLSLLCSNQAEFYFRIR